MLVIMTSQEQKDLAWEEFINHALIATCQLHMALERLRSLGALEKEEEEMIQEEMCYESCAALSASVAEAVLSQEEPLWQEGGALDPCPPNPNSPSDEESS